MKTSNDVTEEEERNLVDEIMMVGEVEPISMEVLDGELSYATSIIYFEKENILVLAGSERNIDSSVQFWNLESFKREKILRLNGCAGMMKWRDDLFLVASKGVIEVYSVKTLDLVDTFFKFDYNQYQVENFRVGNLTRISEDHFCLVYKYSNSMMKIFSLSTKKVTCTFSRGAEFFVSPNRTICPSKTHKDTIYVAREGGKIEVIKFSDEEFTRVESTKELTDHTGLSINSLDTYIHRNKNTEILVAAGNEGMIYFYDMSTLKANRSLQCRNRVGALKIYREHYLFAGLDGGEVVIIDDIQLDHDPVANIKPNKKLTASPSLLDRFFEEFSEDRKPDIIDLSIGGLAPESVRKAVSSIAPKKNTADKYFKVNNCVVARFGGWSKALPNERNRIHELLFGEFDEERREVILIPLLVARIRGSHHMLKVLRVKNLR